MSDIFKRILSNRCEIGGFKCPCCNRFHGKDKNKLNRQARAELRERDIKEGRGRHEDSEI